jgi:serine/threonine-protein kinase
MQPTFNTANPYPQAGEVLDGKYRIERLLGEGGMGAVAKATHLLRRAPVALKFMSPAVLSLSGAVERFVNEGVAASQIDSDHVVKVFDVGRLPSGAPYLVMEFLDGCDLAQLLERERSLLSVPRAVNFTLQILRALQTAHAAGIVHRDMKPSNCFIITKDGEADFVKLVDFGISKVRTGDEAPAAHLTRTNSALGTPLYMSPEQARSPRDVDQRTDIYSTGAILYEMLTGRTPYTAESGEYTEILFKIFTTDVEPIRKFRPELPDGLAAAVHRALVRDLNQRFGSALEFAEAIAAYGDERSSQVITRMRGGRPGSVLPGASGIAGHSVIPSAVEARAAPDDATARTYAAGAVSVRPPGAGPVPTDVGVTRESPGAAPQAEADTKTARGVLFAVAAGVLVLIGGAGAFAVKSMSSSAAPSHTTVEVGHDPSVARSTTGTSTIAPADPETAATTVPTTVTTLVAPSASASASASAEQGAVPKPPPRQVVNPPVVPPPVVPRQLGDVKLH